MSPRRLALAVMLLASAARGQTWVRDVPLTVMDVQATSDGGCIMVGDRAVATWGGGILKLAPDGTVEWLVDMNGPDADSFEAVTELPDGYACAGATQMDPDTWYPWIVKIDRLGNLAWQYRLTTATGGGGAARSIVATADGGVAAILDTARDTVESPTLALVRLDASGALQWAVSYRQTLGNGCADLSFPCRLIAEPDGSLTAGLAIVESCVGYDANFDSAILRFAPDGTLSWQLGIGAPFPSGDLFMSLAPRGDGGYLMATVDRDQSTFPGERSSTLVSLDPDLTIAWARRWGNPGPEESAYAVAATPAGGCVVVGRNYDWPESDRFILRVSPAGDLESMRAFGDSGLYAIVPAPGGGFFAGGDRIEARLDAGGWARSTCMPEVAWAAPFDVHAPRTWDPGRPAPQTTLQVFDAIPTWSRSVPRSTCAIPPCSPLQCGAISVAPAAPCAGRDVVLALEVSGGESPSVGWDLDGDGAADVAGNPVSVRLAAGTWTVTAMAKDQCEPVPQSCQASTGVTVAAAWPPGEVSDVRAGATSLTVTLEGARVEAELLPDATRYNVYCGFIGDWRPSAGAGTTCDAAWLAASGGRAGFDVTIPVDTWILVTGVNDCGEGPPGRTSLAVARDATPGWQHCP